MEEMFGRMTQKQKDIFYREFKQETLGSGYFRVPTQEQFFAESIEPRRPSFWKRLYHTFF
jgi:hypothetical protein